MTGTRTDAAPAVEVHELRRAFPAKKTAEGVVTALDGISLDIAEGEIHGLLGPNGAGKTTLVRILSTVLLPTAGRARVLGHDVVREPAAVRPAIGLVFGGDRGLYARVSARRNLLFWSALYGVPSRTARTRCAALLERFGLAERADEPVEQFSRGMKQRLHLARGLVHEPRLLFLDEPTVGLDPVATRELRGVVRELRDEGRTVLLATHDMTEAETTCDRVTLIDHGRILMTEPTDRVGHVLAAHDFVDFTTSDSALPDLVAALPGVKSVTLDADTGRRRTTLATADAVRPTVAWLAEHGADDIRMTKPSLEDVYLNLMGNRGLLV